MKNASTIKDFKDCVSMGIDVSKADLAIVGMTMEEAYFCPISNRIKPIKSFMQRLKHCGFKGKIICESTGHYHLKLALVCYELDLPLIILNPLQSSKHSKSRIRKTKTDPQDALTQATMGITEPELPEPARLSPAKILIKLKMGQIASVEKQLQKMQQSLNQYEETYADLGLPLSDLQKTLRSYYQQLKKLQKGLEKELEGLLAQELADDENWQKLHKVPGYSDVVSGLVGMLNREVKSAHSWVAYTGLDISVRQSGTWRGRGKLTKRGNAYLRKRLYQAAWGACLNYDYVRAYYDRLKSEGKKHVEAVCVIARKQLRIAYHMVTKNVEFDPKIAFSN